MKRTLILLTAGVLLSSCTVTEVGFEEIKPEKTVVSIPLQSEFDSPDSDTKAYLNSIDANSWNYVWEDDDQMAYFRFRKGTDPLWSTARVDKNEDGTNVLYDGTTLKNGDILYTYLFQPEPDAKICSEIGRENKDPENLYLSIPSLQRSTFGSETFIDEQDLSFSVNNQRLSQTSVNLTGSAVPRYENLGNYVAPKNEILFKVVNYRRNIKYASDGTTNFSIDYYGNATAEFQPVKISEMTKVEESGSWSDFIKNLFTGQIFTETYTTEYPIKVYVDGEDDYVKMDVSQKTVYSASYSYKKGWTYNLTTTYLVSLSKSNALVKVTEKSYGEKKAIPVKDCMPCVSKAYNIKQADVKAPDQIQSYMTMYMLGSVIEFRVFSTDPSIGVGENISAAIFEADKPCAGVGVLNIVSGDLSISEMTENVIESSDFCGQIIGTNKTDDYASIYMVLAPGTYTADIHLISNTNVYTFHAADKTYDRAVRKAFNCNVASSSCVVTPIEDFFNDTTEEQEQDESETGGSEDEDL